MCYGIQQFFKMPIRNSSKSENKILRKIHGTIGIILYVLDSGRTMGVFMFVSAEDKKILQFSTLWVAILTAIPT